MSKVVAFIAHLNAGPEDLSTIPDYRLRQTSWRNESIEITRAAFDTSAFASHFHDGLAIGLVRRGANVFRAAGKQSEVGAGEICIVNPGEVHDGGRSGKPWAYDNVLVPLPVVTSIAEELGIAPELDRHHVNQPKCVDAAQTFFRLAHDDPQNAEMVEEAGLHLIATLLRQHTSAARRSAAPEPLLAIRTYEALRDHTASRLTLSELEDALGASRFQIIRAVHARYGLTPHQLQLQLRVQRAREQILAGIQIADAAIAYGFADQAHLTREMKRRWGIPPGRMRRSSDQV